DDEWQERVDAVVGTAVRRQLVSDVPLGAFLSGGVDSSLVVAHMGPTTAYTIGFDDPSYSEVEWARRVAAHLEVAHNVDLIRPQQAELFDGLMRFMDDPIGDFSIFPTYLVSRHARSEVKVALSGDGGDELFGGYETYIAQERARLWRRLPSFGRSGLSAGLDRMRPRPEKKGLVNKAKRFVEGLGHDEALGHARWRLFMGRRLRETLFTPATLDALNTEPESHILELFEQAGDRSKVSAGLYVDMRSYLTDNCLVKVDRMSMACSLEVRLPLLDHEVAELAFRLPDHLKVKGGKSKPLLKQIAARHVPRDCVYRPKEGFSIPMKHWLGGPLRHLMEELLSTDRLGSEGVFRVETVERLKREHLGGQENHSHILWSLMVFEDWRQRWRV
ncbi:MAG: asparagine synthetase B family protein, partial [Planctomycetota bacterium]